MCYIYAKSYHDCPDVKNKYQWSVTGIQRRKGSPQIGEIYKFCIEKRMLGRLQGGEGNAVRKKREKSQACLRISKWLSVDGA